MMQHAKKEKKNPYASIEFIIKKIAVTEKRLKENICVSVWFLL